MIELNYRDGRPIYEQIYDGLRRLILTGALQTEEKLPSVRALATQLSINPNTIQRAYNALETEGCIYSVAGKGSFVAPVAAAGQKRREELARTLRETVSELRTLGLSAEEAAALIKEVYEQ